MSSKDSYYLQYDLLFDDLAELLPEQLFISILIIFANHMLVEAYQLLAF
jgi:hypothetical protein